MRFMYDLALSGERSFVESAPLLEMLEQHPSTSVVFTADAAVEEVLVHGRHDEAARRQQLAQVPYPGSEKSFMLWLPCR